MLYENRTIYQICAPIATRVSKLGPNVVLGNVGIRSALSLGKGECKGHVPKRGQQTAVCTKAPVESLFSPLSLLCTPLQVNTSHHGQLPDHTGWPKQRSETQKLMEYMTDMVCCDAIQLINPDLLLECDFKYRLDAIHINRERVPARANTLTISARTSRH